MILNSCYRGKQVKETMCKIMLQETVWTPSNTQRHLRQASIIKRSLLNRVLGMLACFACLRACVLGVLTCFVLGVLACVRAWNDEMFYVLTCLRTCVLFCLICFTFQYLNLKFLQQKICVL